MGECVRLRDQASWVERRPLHGLRIGITRPAGQAEETLRRARQLGAEPIVMPTIAVAPLDDWTAVDKFLDTLSPTVDTSRTKTYSWLVFTSVNGVDGLLGRLWDRGLDGRALSGSRLAAIGPATAERLAQWHLKADLVPSEYRAEALAAALEPQVVGQRVLWVKASRGRDVLPQQLRAAGANLDELPVYQNIDATEFSPQVIELLKSGHLDWIGLSSPSGARSLARLLPVEARVHLGQSLRLAAISPVTAEAALEAGLPINATATEYTWDGLFDAIAAAR